MAAKRRLIRQLPPPLVDGHDIEIPAVKLTLARPNCRLLPRCGAWTTIAKYEEERRRYGGGDARRNTRGRGRERRSRSPRRAGWRGGIRVGRGGQTRRQRSRSRAQDSGVLG